MNSSQTENNWPYYNKFFINIAKSLHLKEDQGNPPSHEDIHNKKKKKKKLVKKKTKKTRKTNDSNKKFYFQQVTEENMGIVI